MPDVTVAMPARNAAAFIGPAIDSVRRQEGVDWELVVVDDASEDGTRSVVSGFRDPRITLLHNDTRRGIAACHNAVLSRGTAPFIAHVDADDLLCPGALRAMVDALRRSPRAGQAYSHFVYIDRAGRLLRPGLAVHRHYLRSREHAEFDYRRRLLVHGMVVNTLRTYRRDIFDVVGRFNETLPFGVDWEMAVRVADCYEMVLVPRILYLVRIHGANTTVYERQGGVARWWWRYRVVRGVLRNRKRLLGRSPTAVHALMLISLLHELGVERSVKAVARAPIRLWRQLSVASRTSS